LIDLQMHFLCCLFQIGKGFFHSFLHPSRILKASAYARIYADL
jgi:hypothetical protein